jgi:RimJ/RimL family protein N-acetyltransferase
MQPIVTTERLVLRAFDSNDHAFIIQLLNSEGWLQYIGNRNITGEKQAITYINDVLRASYLKNGYGLYLAELKDGNVPVGICGFVKRDLLPHADLGFAFLPAYHGTGLAYESASAVLNFGFSKLAFEKVAAITKPSNERSVKLLEKLGFCYERDIIQNEELLMLFGRDSDAVQPGRLII